MALPNIFILHGAPKIGKSQMAWMLFQNLIHEGASLSYLATSLDGSKYEELSTVDVLQFNPIPHVPLSDGQLQCFYFRAVLTLRDVCVVMTNRGNDEDSVRAEAYWSFSRKAGVYIVISRKMYIDKLLDIANQLQGGYHVDDTSIPNSFLVATTLDEKEKKLRPLVDKVMKRIRFVIMDSSLDTSSIIENNNKEGSNSFTWKRGLVYMGGLIIVGALIVGVIYSIAKPHYLSDSNLSIVLSFVGIIATFIVVGNYAQVSEIREDMKRRLSEYETKIQKRINESREDAIKQTYSTISKTMDAKLNSLQDKVDKIERNIFSNNNIVNESINKIDDKITTNIDNLISQLVEKGISVLPGYMAIVNKILNTPEGNFVVKTGKIQHKKTHFEISEEGNIKAFFLTKGGKKNYCTSISEIDGVTVDYAKIQDIIQLLFPIKQPVRVISPVAEALELSSDKGGSSKTFKS